MYKTLIRLVVVTLGLVTSQFAFATDWSADQYDLYTGDFNGDGKSDILYVAKDPAGISGIAVSDGSAPNIPWQTWPSNYLGIPWSGNQYNIVVADFNGDGKADILLQRATSGDSYLLLADSGGKIVAISQTISNGALGITWSADQHKIVAGDINNDGKADLFLQATSSSGTNAVVYADSSGTFTTGPTQTWSEGYLGLNWSTQNAKVFLGDFNGDHLSDLLIQAKPKFVMIDYDVTFPVPTYPPNMNGVLYSQGGGTPYQLAGLQPWSRMNNGVDWSPLTNNLVVGDFNGDGRADVLFLPKYSTGTTAFITGSASGAAFSATATAVSSNVALSADSARVIVGNFDGGTAVGIYVQTLTPSGSNSYANTVGSTVAATTHDTTVATGVVPATAVGFTPGSFAVSNSGAATYGIPVVVPPGVSGIEPKLSIAYQSGGGNGYLGVGWSIGGLSQIERCRKTIAQDGANSGVTLTSSDVFCLDGNRLRLTSGTYGQASSTYQTEQETFSRITANGQQGNGPASFKVEGKNGLYYEYGNTADSFIESTSASYSTTARVWLLNKVSDRSGNALTISYIEDGAPNGSYRPNEINYTSNSAAGLSPAYKVKFYWDTRPAADVYSGYYAGGSITESYRLNHIETQYYDPSVSAFRLVRKYQLSYNTSGVTQRSRLAAVQECERGGTCLSPTEISWQDGRTGFEAQQSAPNMGSLSANAIRIDIDGDGRTDAVYPSSSTNTWWYMLASSSGGYSAAVDTGISDVHYDQALPIDYNSDGSMDLLVPNSSNVWQVLQANGHGFTVVTALIAATGTGFSATGADGKAWVVDIDGDARQDIVWVSNTQLFARFNTGNGFSTSVTTLYTLPTNWQFLTQAHQLIPDAFASRMHLADFNGDGRTDLVIYAQDIHSTTATLEPYVLLSTGASYVAANVSLFTPVLTTIGSLDAVTRVQLSTWRLLDLNGDGMTDVAYACTNKQTWCVRFGTGNALGAEINTGISWSSSLTEVVALDWDGDGKMDLLEGGAGTNWQVLRATGLSGAPLNGPVDAGFSVSGFTSQIGDINGDGLSDLFYLDSSKNVYYRLHSGATGDLVRAVSDGFGNNVSVTYKSMTDSSVYTKGAGATYPEMDVQYAMPLVDHYTATTGTAAPTSSDGQYTVTERYAGARVNLNGRGFEGFLSRTETDSRTSISTKMVFNQVFPYTGTVSSVTATQPNGHVISYTGNTYNDIAAGAVYNDRHYAYASHSAQTSYEVSTDVSIDGASIKSVSTDSTGLDSFGNPATVTVTNTDLTGSGQAFTAVTNNTYLNDATNWCLGMVTQQTVSSSIPNAMPLAGNVSPTRTIKLDPDLDATKCRIYKQTIEPGASNQVITTSEYDSFGHTWRTTTAPNGQSSRVAWVSYGAEGVFAKQFTNAVSETSDKTYDYALGVPLTATDANGLQSSVQYDGFGRKVLATATDGTQTRWSYIACSGANGYCGDSLLRYQIQQQQLDGSTGHNVIRTDMEYFDSFNRSLYKQTQTLSNAYSVVRNIYNSLGQLMKTSAPYFAGAVPTYATNYYDLVGRLVKTERQASESDASLQTVLYGYSKLTTSVTDPLGSVTSKTANAIGQVVQVTDPQPSSTSYQYDALGNLAKVTDSAGNQVTSTYNLRGFKVSSSDPDMGNWSYDYWSSGELKTQTDAKNQVVSFTYDAISRPATRTESEGTTTWTYGSTSTAAAHNVGQLQSVTAPGGYAESYAYDNLGRTQTITYTEDITYQVDYAYNSLGALDTVTYPLSTSGYRFKAQYGYTNGQLSKVSDAAAGTAFWVLNATNAANQAIDEQMANGVRIISGFDTISGSISYRQSGNGGSTSNLQNLSYQWDKNGNLKQRQDVIQNLTEIFNYDALNRVRTSTLNGSQNLGANYDAIGNITTKSDVSTSSYNYTTTQAGCSYYGYGQPHAVRSIGTNVYCYDANGNMTNRAGGAIAWTSYNLPSQINSGSNYSQFSYGANRNRWKQVANYSGTTETTMYVGGLLEKVTRNGVTEYKHYIAGGSATAIYTRRDSGTTSTYYATSDHLGSGDVITDGTGAAVVRESFAAFGARRGSNWTGSPSVADQAQFTATTRHGYTGHEMLDNLSLIHMNGRVYDPTVGRFISADPQIQSPLNQQSLNRYSYLMNGPMSGTDPSGYFGWRSLFDPFDNVGRWVTASAISIQSPYPLETMAVLVASRYLNQQTDRFLQNNPDLQPVVRVVVDVVVAYYAGPDVAAYVDAGMAAHFTRINGGSNRDILRSYAVAYATSYAFNWVGNNTQGMANTVGHAAVGCASAAAGGGNCGQGALSAGFGAAFSNYAPASLKAISGGPVGSMILGGIGAELGGGEFSQGAMLAGIGYVFNSAFHENTARLDGNVLTGDVSVSCLNATETECAQAIERMKSVNIKLDDGYGVNVAVRKAGWWDRLMGADIILFGYSYSGDPLTLGEYSGFGRQILIKAGYFDTTVPAHEFVHYLGFTWHSSDPNSLMYPSYSPNRRSLTNQDVKDLVNAWQVH